MNDNLAALSCYESFNLDCPGSVESALWLADVIWQQSRLPTLIEDETSGEVSWLICDDPYSEPSDNNPNTGSDGSATPSIASAAITQSQTFKHWLPWQTTRPKNYYLLESSSPFQERSPGLSISDYDRTIQAKRLPLLQIVNRKHSIDRIAKLISSHEGAADQINWNDNGAGISVGMFQANQKYGQLPDLLRRMEQANPPIFISIFGEQFADLVSKSPEKIHAVPFTNALKSGPNELGIRLSKAIKIPQFQEVQLAMLHENINHARAVAAQYGIKSDRGVALVADMINQLGEGGAHRGARQYLTFALNKQGEDEKLNAIAEHDYKGAGRARRDRHILSFFGESRTRIQT